MGFLFTILNTPLPQLDCLPRIVPLPAPAPGFLETSQTATVSLQ
jgi:hypothetical protein